MQMHLCARLTVLVIATLLGMQSSLASDPKPIPPPPATAHVDPALMTLREARQKSLARGQALSNDHPLLVLNAAADKVLVRVTADDVDVVLPSLRALGFEVVASLPERHLVEGFLPVDALPDTETLGNAGHLGGVLPVLRPAGGVGLVTSQGDFIHEADRVRATSGRFDGTGVRVGVLSDSYNILGGSSKDISTGDLPAAGSITLQKEGPSGSADEGRAMMQIVHDLAPGAPLAFASAFYGEADFATQIRALANASGCRVITDDIFYYAEPMFQDGVIAQAINDVVTNNGVAYFSLAGNLADNGWETTTPQFAADATLGGSYLVFDPNATSKTRQRLVVQSGQQIIITVQWDNPFYTTNGVTADLDLYLLTTGTTNVLTSSARNSITNQTPSETIYYYNSSGSTQTYDLAVLLRSGPKPGRVKWVNFGANSYGVVTVLDAPRSTPTVISHSAAVNARSVGAVNFYDQLNPASFSSYGPSTFLFEANGTRKAAAEVRQTPQMAAIQGVDTTFFGGDFDGNGYPNFFGTSAAAPTAAAIGALIRQAKPSFTPAQIYAAMQSTAADLGTPGFDNVSGYGLVDAWRAIFGSPVPATLPFYEGFETGGLTLPWELRDTVAGRTLVTTANAPAAGTYHLTMDGSLNGYSSLNEATLHVNASGSDPIYLVFNEREFNDPDNPMPATFPGSSNADGVAFSTDGTNWVRAISLTGSASTNTYQKTQINLSQLAASFGVALGSDTRIKFQHYGSGLIANAGLAFDSVVVLRNAPADAVFTSGAPPAATVGVPYSFTFTTSGNPPPTFSLGGASPPQGLSLNPNTGVLSGTPGRPGAYGGVQVTAANGYTAPGTQTVTIRVNNRFDFFASANNLTGADAAPDADPDHDGLPNLLEYALALSPTVANMMPAATLQTYGGSRYLSLRFTRVPLATDLTYVVEVSSDLSQWSAVATSVGGAAFTGPGVVSDDGINLDPHPVEIRDTVASGTAAGQRRFLRIRVSK